MPSPDYSPDGRWEVRWVCTKDFNSYFESDTRYEIRVINRRTKQVVVSFVRDEFANAEGCDNSGVRTTAFLPDGVTLRATYEDGRIEDVTLPARDR